MADRLGVERSHRARRPDDRPHPPWPLHRAQVVACRQDLFEVAGLPAPVGEPVALWSPGVEVRVARPRRIRPTR